MWICSQLGFFSIVQKLPGEYHLRARVRADLTGLCQAAGWPEDRVIETAGDYRWRVIASAADVLRAMEVLGRAVDYANFKGRIAALPGQRDKLPAYHDLWQGLFEVQLRHGHLPSPPRGRG